MPEHDTSIAAALLRSAGLLLLLLALPLRAQVPAFSAHPCDETLSAGDRLALAVKVSPQPGQLQWLKNDTPIPGATGPVFEIPSVQPGDTAFYRCAAITGIIETWSLPARVTVLQRQARPGDLDTSFAAGFPGMMVNALLPAADGGWYAGGVTETGTGLVLRLSAAGQPVAGFSAPAFDNEVLCLTLQGSVLWAGGRFTGGLRRLSAGTGTARNVQPPVAGGDVFCLATDAAGRALAGGSFTTADGQPRRALAAFSNTGVLDPVINGSTPLQLDGDVSALAVQAADGAILLGGKFLTINGIRQRRVARLKADGSHDLAFARTNWPNREVLALAVDGSGRVLLGGPFQKLEILNGSGNLADGQAHSGLMRFSATGVYDSAFQPDLYHKTLPVTVRTIAAGAGRIAAGGDFTRSAGISAPCLLFLTNEGLPDPALVPPFGFSGSDPGGARLVRAAALTGDGGAVAAGSFTSPGPGLLRIIGTPSPAPAQIRVVWPQISVFDHAPCEVRASVTGWPLPATSWTREGVNVAAENGVIVCADSISDHSGSYSVNGQPGGVTTVKVSEPGLSEPRWHGYAPSSGLPLTVPNDSVVSSKLLVPDSFTISRAAVRVSLQHSNLNAVEIRLTPPGGAGAPLLLLGTTDLKDPSIPRRQHLEGLRFDPASALPVTAVRAPYTASVVPADPSMENLAGRSAAGEWTLTITDSRLDKLGGSLVSWQLELLEIPPPPDYAAYAAALPQGMTGPDEDADGDGISNFAEYAYPGSSALSFSGGLWFLLETRRTDQNLTFSTEGAPDLIHWQDLSPQIRQEIRLPGYTSRVRLLLPSQPASLWTWRGRVW